MKIYVGEVEALRKKERGDETMKLSLPPKLVEKLVWVPVISCCISFPVTHSVRPIMLKLAILGR